MPNIVYLHGFGSGPDSTKGRFFQRNFSMIGAEVYQPDLAEGDFQGMTITAQLAVVDRAVREREPVLLAGSSLGGYLAALYAARHPERVPSLVLLAPAFGFARRWAEQLGEAEMAAWREQGVRLVHHYGAQDSLPIGYQLYEDALQYEDFPDVKQPTLVFHGRMDETVKPELSTEFAWSRANVQLQFLDSDHQMLDVVETIWERVAMFYQETEPLRG